MMEICPLDQSTVQIGNMVRSSVLFTNIADNGTPIDPDSVHVDILDPDGLEVNYQFAVGSEITRDGIGIYWVEYTVAVVGTWYFRWWSTGRGESSTEQPVRVIDAKSYP